MSEPDPRIERLERQVIALAKLLAETLDLLRNAALNPYQTQERSRCEQLIQTAKTIKTPQSN